MYGLRDRNSALEKENKGFKATLERVREVSASFGARTRVLRFVAK